jgi:hypothetical protein
MFYYTLRPQSQILLWVGGGERLITDKDSVEKSENPELAWD